jgi:hypothetical protein
VAQAFGALVAVAILLAVAWSFGAGAFLKAMSDPPSGPPPEPTQHEGTVSKVVVNDPHDGGWGGRQSNPQEVVLTVAGRTYDLDGPLGQAAAVRPGDRVAIECVMYDTWDEPSCRFGGVIIERRASR